MVIVPAPPATACLCRRLSSTLGLANARLLDTSVRLSAKGLHLSLGGGALLLGLVTCAWQEARLVCWGGS